MNTGLSREEIIRLLNKGFTRTEIALEYGVTPQAVNWHLNEKHGGEPYKDPRQEAMEHIPWEVSPDHKISSGYHRLREHVKYVALGSGRLSDAEIHKLRTWYGKLESLGVVLEYDPSVQPTPTQSHGGWRYVPREERDDDLIIRVNRLAKMSDEAHIIFRRPKKLP